jgi:hypothetical protein
MFADEIRRAVETAPRVKLAGVGEVLWRAWAAGQVSDTEAEELSQLLEARKALPAPEKPVRRHVGSRPRSSASMERRRSWAAAGRLPPAIAARFTMAEQAVLAVVASQAQRAGACMLTIGHIAALAGVSETTVRNAVREAKALGLILVEESRRSAWISNPNRLTIISREWSAWLKLTGANSRSPRIPEDRNGLAQTRESFIHERQTGQDRDRDRGRGYRPSWGRG